MLGAALSLLLATAPAAACHDNPLGTRALYVRGDFNNWNATDDVALRWICDRFEGVVTIDKPARFKIGDEGWSKDADFGTPDRTTSDQSRPEALQLVAKGSDLKHDFHGTQRIRLAMAQDDPLHPTLSIEDCPLTTGGVSQTVYLRGDLNNWGALDAYAFQFSCDAYYLNVELNGRYRFKLADAAWTPASTWGVSKGLAMQEHEPVNLARADKHSGGELGELEFDFHGQHTLRFAFPGGQPQLTVGPKSFADPREEGVQDPVARSLRHDSRASSDRTPFGAVPAGTEVEFALHADAGVESATLVLESRRLEGNQDLLEYTEVARVPMQASPEGKGSVFRVRHRFDDKGIVGYWFLVRIGGKDYAYQNNRDAVPWTREKGSGGLGLVDALPAATPGDDKGSAYPFVRRYRLTVYDRAFKVPDWAQDAVYYYIFPDRFRNGDRSNDPQPGARKYHEATVELHRNWLDKPWRPGDGSDQYYNNDFFGGDLAGIIEKLDYIASLGANVIYMTPVFLSASNHKYDTADYRRIDPAFGDEAAFAKLCEEARKRGIRVLPDTSLNHVGQDSLYFDRFGNYGGQGAFANGKINPASPYYSWFTFDASQAAPDKQYKGWVGISDLPELDKNSPGWRKFAYGTPDSVTQHWLKLGASGWRMDVAPWVPDDFWREWRAAVKAQDPQAITVAETWFDASKYFVGDMFDSTMNYIFRNSLLDYANGGDARASYRNLELLRENYPPQALHAAMNLLSTHDTARSLHLFGWKDGASAEAIALAKQRLKLAMFFQFTYPGAPAIFYGDEVGVTGGEDPFNRVTYPWEDLGGQPDKALLEYVRALGKLRGEHPVLARGSLDAPIYLDEHVVVLLRRHGGEWAITAVNNGAAPTHLRLALPDGAPSEFRDALNDARVLPRNDAIEFEVPAMSGRALVYDARTALR